MIFCQPAFITANVLLTIFYVFRLNNRAFIVNYCFWLIFSTMITTFYTGSLLSFLLDTKYQKPFKTLADVPDNFPVYSYDYSNRPMNCTVITFINQWQCRSIKAGNALFVDEIKDHTFVFTEILTTLTKRQGLMPLLYSKYYTIQERKIKKEFGIDINDYMYLIPSYRGNFSSSNGFFFNRNDERMRRYFLNVAFFTDYGIFRGTNARSKKVRSRMPSNL